MKSRYWLVVLLSAAACNKAEPAQETAQKAEPAQTEAAATSAPSAAPLAPTPIGGGEDRTPVSEAPFTPTSAQGAANVVQTYFALMEAEKPADAWKLRRPAAGETEAQLADTLNRYAEYHAQIGAPGAIEGAAGSLYVTVPVKLYGRRASGEAFEREGSVTLRRSNDVPGATAEQRTWRIESASPADLLR